MELRDYPRPRGDTGIGVHWNAGFPNVLGSGAIRERWLPELIAMGVKWVKIARHDGGRDFDALLLEHDIMPVIRIYRPQPNPGVLDADALRLVREHVAAGVRYFEFNNEPDLSCEWQSNYLPPNALEVVARNAIVDMERILELGGYPGIPAMSVGSKWDLVGEICRLGRRDLFREPVWQAVHNYSINHPLDYPYDSVNQQGTPVSQDVYDQLAAERWEGDAWGGWSLERVNQERQGHANPGATAFDDPSCWRAYERYDRLIRSQVGRSLPILGTENGFIVGERPDPRYPATTPLQHMAGTLEACRIMMGTSASQGAAPDYYFCTAFWLLGNYSLGHWSPDWENAAWYSQRWAGGQLPIVAALKTEPKRERVWQGGGARSGRITGTLKNGAGLTVRLASSEGWHETTRAGQDSHYAFLDVPFGTYAVTVLEAKRSQSVAVSAARPAVTADFDLTDIPVDLGQSTVRGTVDGGAGRVLLLSRPADGWVTETTVAADGSFHIGNLQAGSYTLALLGTDSVWTDILLDGRNEVVLSLAAPGWGWQTDDGGASPGFGILRCRVAGHPNVAVRIWTGGWEGITRNTGEKAEYGPDVCEFAPLGAGTYYVQPSGLDVQATVTLDGSRVVWLTFTEVQAPPPRESVIAGHVYRGSGCTVLLAGEERRQSTTVAGDQTYRFQDLAAGTYRLEVSETDLSQDGIVLDGTNHVQVDFELSEQPGGWRWRVEDGSVAPGYSVIRCSVAGKPDVEVRISADGWEGFSRRTGSKSEYGPDACEFAPLNAGVYLVEPAGLGARATVSLPASRILWVIFEPVLEAEAQGRAAAPVSEIGVAAVEGADPPVPETTYAIEHYLLMASMPRSREDFLAVLQYVGRFGPAIGCDQAEAHKARHVTILGSTRAIGTDVESELRAGGHQVHRIERDYAQVLAHLLTEDRPY